MGCCGNNSDNARSDNVEMKGGGKGGKNGGGKWGEFYTVDLLWFSRLMMWLFGGFVGHSVENW